MAHNIKVAVGEHIKRESVLIDPNMSAAEPAFADSASAADDNPAKNIIARGANPNDALKNAYGR
jgi:hypothetical protein